MTNGDAPMKTVTIRLFVCVLVSFGLGALTFLTMNGDTQAQPAADVGPDLLVAKHSIWPFAAFVEPGGVITFAILVENLGIGQARNVVLTDTLPEGLTFVGANNNLCGGPCPMEIKGQQVIWQMGALAPDTRWQWMELWARVNVAATVGAILTNTVEIRGANAEIDSDPNDEIADPYANNRSTREFEVVSAFPDLEIYKEIAAGVAAAGENLRYRILLVNQGLAAADNVIVTDTLPISVTYLAHGSDYPISAPMPVTPTVNGRQIVWNLGRVPPHGWGYLTVDVRVSDAATAGARLINEATVSTSSPQLGRFADEFVREDVIVAAVPDLWVDKLADGPRAPSSRFDYRIRLANNGGGSATAVRITDTLPAELRFITATSQSCLDPLNPDDCQADPFTMTLHGRQIVWEIGRVPPGIGETYVLATVEVSPTLVPGAMITNVVQVAGNEMDSNPNDNSYTSTLPVVESSDPDIAVFKSLESPPPRPGGPIIYRLRVVNQGAFALPDVILTDTLPAATILRETINTTCFAPPDCVDDAFAPAVQGNVLVWNLGEIAVNGYGSFWVTVDAPMTATAGTGLTNTARISAAALETDLTDNESLAAVTVIGEPRLVISKTAPAVVLQNYSITYTLWVGNAGDAAATELVITDAVPAGAFLRNVIGGIAAGGIVTWNLASLNAGVETGVSFVVTATDTISNSRYGVVARAGVSATGAAVTTTVISLTAASSSPARVGEPTHFTATLSSPTLMTYRWDFGDGAVSAPTAAPTITHSYARHGRFTAAVTATSDLGSLTATTPVIVRPYPLYLPLVIRSAGIQ